MSYRLSLKRALGLALLFLSLPEFAQASPFSLVVAYGDSLSDNGNLFAASGQPGPPYFEGRRSDGTVAVEKLASALGTPLLDFAWLGATTGIGNIADGGTPTNLGAFSLPGMQAEFATTQTAIVPYLVGGLFVVWGGADDFLSPSPLDTTTQAIVSRAVSDELSIVFGLRLLGAQNILVPGMPDIGLTPFYQSLGPSAAAQASAATDAFNAALLSGLPAGVQYYDTASLERSMVANPAAFGFTDTTDPCFDGSTLCADPSKYLFFDSFHPTTAADGFAAQGFLAAVTPPVPAPETSAFVLTFLGLASCTILRRSKNKKVRGL